MVESREVRSLAAKKGWLNHPLTEISKKRFSEAKQGKNNPNYGKSLRESTKEKISNSLEGNKNPMFGKHHKDTTKKKMSFKKKGRYTGQLSHNWKGGISFAPYCPKFTNEFKERVRAFFNYLCVECGTPQNEKKLHVHHVNFNKMTCCDNTKPLFVALCPSCHAKTQFNRGYWENHFIEILTKYYNGNCFLESTE